MLASNAQTDRQVNVWQTRSLRNIESFMCAPLWSHNDTIGALYLDTSIAEEFQPADLESKRAAMRAARRHVSAASALVSGAAGRCSRSNAVSSLASMRNSMGSERDLRSVARLGAAQRESATEARRHAESFEESLWLGVSVAPAQCLPAVIRLPPRTATTAPVRPGR